MVTGKFPLVCIPSNQWVTEACAAACAGPQTCFLQKPQSRFEVEAIDGLLQFGRVLEYSAQVGSVGLPQRSSLGVILLQHLQRGLDYAQHVLAFGLAQTPMDRRPSINHKPRNGLQTGHQSIQLQPGLRDQGAS